MHLIRMTAYSIMALALLVGAGCGSRQTAAKTATAEPADRAPATTEPEAPPRGDAGEEGEQVGDEGDAEVAFTPVYFEFDSSVILPDQRDKLDQIATYLQDNPEVTLLVEGHTDSRGTDEYNIALGERRAQVVQDYLLRLGVDGARLSTISYGEERPAADGEEEEAWAKNRRAELIPSR